MVDPAEADRARQSGLNPIRGGRKISGKTEVGAARGQAVAVAALDDTSRAEAERKLSVAKAARAELALQIEQGKYVELAAFKRECERMVVAAKTRLRAIPNSLAPELAVITNTAVIFTRLQESIDEALSELASAEYLDKES
jgi:hypothetical protein